MPTADELAARLTNNPSFLEWLRGQAQGRGVPSWDPTTAGRSGGFPGRLPGMPRAPGTSPSQMQTRFGGTYAPSGNMPAPSVGGGGPAIGGSGVGGPPAPGLGSRLVFRGSGGALGMLPAVAGQRDVGSPRHTQQEMTDWLMRRNQQPAPSQSAQPSLPTTPNMPIPIPNAPATPPTAQLIPPAAAAPMRPTPVGGASQSPMQPAPSAPWTPPNNATVPFPKSVAPPQAPAQVPIPTPRPQAQIPLPQPRPQMPLPTPRPIPRNIPMPQRDPRQAQAAQNQSILDVLLNSFNPNAAWRQQYR